MKGPTFVALGSLALGLTAIFACGPEAPSLYNGSSSGTSGSSSGDEGDAGGASSGASSGTTSTSSSGGTDAGVTSFPFAPKTTCDAPKRVVDNAPGEGAAGVGLAGAAGSPLALTWAKTSGSDTGPCELRLWDGAAFASPATLAATCRAPRGRQLAAGGGAAAVMASSPGTASNGRRARANGATWTAILPVTNRPLPDSAFVRVGPGGHTLEAWSTGTELHLGLAAPTATTLTELPAVDTGRISGAIGAVVGATGDGFGFWANATQQITTRAFKAGAWAGAEGHPAPAVGAVEPEIHAVPLTGGDAYVVWGTTGLNGARVHFDGASTVFGAVDTITNAGSFALGNGEHLVATPDGELTLVFAAAGGLLKGTRKVGAAAWTAPVDLGAFVGTPSIHVDASGHVTAARAQSDGQVFHHRVAKGSTTWSPPVRVDAATGAGAGGPAGVGVDAATGNPVFAWSAGGDVWFTVCR